MATITPIEGRTVHQIQSGQVIIDLCSVVKELVENSLDAGAKSIEVRFKNQGLDSIEVQDNGSGITPENYENVALKHHTSKLSTYSDLTNLQTFGFRGEALSSLCALSKFTVTTCLASDTPRGTKLEFETSGKLKSTSVVAALKGTTVLVENLFQNLPVRRRELERNIKREWNRVIGLLGQYACIQTGVKISATQQVLKGKKTTIFSTKGNSSTRENIINVFGAKTFTALLAVNLKLELEPSNERSKWSAHKEDSTTEVRIVGYISRPAFGEGRQTPDRQMFFVNTRPCGLPQFAKVFNEVYKSYNSSQSPFIFANIEIDTHLYDVNVSPDKRTILLHDQTSMLEHLKTSLTELFESQDYTVPVSHLPTQKQSIYRQLTITQPDVIAKGISQISPQSVEIEEESDHRGSSASTDHNVNEDGYPNKRNFQALQNAISQDSTSRDQEANSLVSSWLGRHTEERSSERGVSSRGNDKSGAELSKEKLRRIANMEKEDNQASDVSEPMEIPERSTDDLQPVPEISIQLMSSNKVVEEMKPRNGTDLERVFQREDSIPAINTPARQSLVSAKKLSSNKTPLLRSPITVTTITIGDRTVTSSIGSPAAKRARIEKSVNVVGQSPVPSFGGRLSQRFTASGPALSLGEGEMSVKESVTESDSSQLAEDQSIAAQSAEHSEKESANPSKVSVNDSSPSSPTEDLDGDYVDEDGRKALEEAKVQEMIRTAEEEAARSSDDNVKRARLLLKGSANRKDSTLQLVHSVHATVERLRAMMQRVNCALNVYNTVNNMEDVAEESLDTDNQEDILSLTINKSDFEKMKIIGQFNLGFILALRASLPVHVECEEQNRSDELFIIDQHASDEKYNFERLQATTIVQSQRLVRPKTLDLTVMEEEIVIGNRTTLETNGFVLTVDESGNIPVGQRCQLISLPLSRETTFSLSDLEELLSLLSENSTGRSIPRPSKVRKMFAMRACRSSIMIGRTLTHAQMGKVVKHMGEIDKPWNCPHGRPTMRHLFKLNAWDEVSWREGDGIDGDKGGATDWAGYIRKKRR